jgi:Peptidase family M48
MFSLGLSLWGKFNYPINDAFQLANHTVPLSIAEKQRVPWTAIKSGPLFEEWNEFASKFPKGKTVKLVHGALPMCSMALGTFLFKNSPKVMAIDIGLEYIDQAAATWFCKHEFAHIHHNDMLKQYIILLVTSVATSFFCTSWYSPLLIGCATHLVAEKTLGLRAEINADNLALENATEEELRGAVRFFAATIQVEHELCPPNSSSNKIKKFVRELFARHPCNNDRMAKVEELLKSRFNYTQIKLDEIRKDDRIQKLKKYTVFRAKTLPTDPQYQDKIEKVLQDLGVPLNFS